MNEVVNDDKIKFYYYCLKISFQYGGEKFKDKVLNVVVIWKMFCEMEVLKISKEFCEVVDKEVECLVMRIGLEIIMEVFKDVQNYELFV